MKLLKALKELKVVLLFNQADLINLLSFLLLTLHLIYQQGMNLLIKILLFLFYSLTLQKFSSLGLPYHLLSNAYNPSGTLVATNSVISINEPVFKLRCGNSISIILTSAG